MFFESIENYHNFLNSEYNDLQGVGTENLRTNGILPPSIRILDDKRRSLDTYYNFPQNLREVVDETILEPAKKLFDELEVPQLVFSGDWLHMSQLVIMAAEIQPPFDPSTENIQDYHRAVQEALKQHHPFEITFSRLIPFPEGILLGGFPENLEVEQVRDRLRNLLDSRSLRRFERRPLQINHITLVRWDNPVRPPLTERVIEFTERLDGQAIWRGIFDTVDFAIGGYNSSPENTTLLERFKLK